MKEDTETHKLARFIAHDVNNILSSIEAEARASLADDSAELGRILAEIEKGTAITRELLKIGHQGDLLEGKTVLLADTEPPVISNMLREMKMNVVTGSNSDLSLILGSSRGAVDLFLFSHATIAERFMAAYPDSKIVCVEECDVSRQKLREVLELALEKKEDREKS